MACCAQVEGIVTMIQGARMGMSNYFSFPNYRKIKNHYIVLYKHFFITQLAVPPAVGFRFDYLSLSLPSTLDLTIGHLNMHFK